MVSSLKLRFEPAHARQCLNKFIIALAQSQPSGFKFEIMNYEL